MRTLLRSILCATVMGCVCLTPVSYVMTDARRSTPKLGV